MNEQELDSQRADYGAVRSGQRRRLSHGSEQQNRFFRKMMDDAVILKDARMIPMARPKMEINKIGFGTRVLRAAQQGNISTPEMGETGSRALARARTVTCRNSAESCDPETSEVIAEIDLPYEVLEDSHRGRRSSTRRSSSRPSST
jgi:hypothetical protein